MDCFSLPFGLPKTSPMNRNDITVSADGYESAASVTSTISSSYRYGSSSELLDTSFYESKDQSKNYRTYPDDCYSLESDIEDSDIEKDDEEYCEQEEPTNSTVAPSKTNANANGTRLDSFDSYIVVSVLTATASFAALLDDNPETDKSLAQRPIARNVAIFLCAICSLSGIYSTVVFSFSSIYGRTALGMGNDQACEAFLKATASMRKKAFHSYLMSLVLFVVLLVIAAVDKIDPQLEIPLILVLAVLSALVYRDWGQIVQAAGIIFAPPPKTTPTQAKRPRATKKHSQHKNRIRHIRVQKSAQMMFEKCKQL